jgi:hypothetical protein
MPEKIEESSEKIKVDQIKTESNSECNVVGDAIECDFLQFDNVTSDVILVGSLVLLWGIFSILITYTMNSFFKTLSIFLFPIALFMLMIYLMINDYVV